MGIKIWVKFKQMLNKLTELAENICKFRNYVSAKYYYLLLISTEKNIWSNSRLFYYFCFFHLSLILYITKLLISGPEIGTNLISGPEIGKIFSGPEIGTFFKGLISISNVGNFEFEDQRLNPSRDIAEELD